MASHLNVLMIPLMAPGHSIPIMDMAKLLAKRRLTVTILVTPLTAARFSSTFDRAIGSGLSIRLLEIAFPAEAAGLPPGSETVDSLPSFTLVRNFTAAVALLQKPVEDELKAMKLRPDCIISDKHVTWTAETCKKFEIPRIIFDGMSCFSPLVISRLYDMGVDRVDCPVTEAFAVPGLPDKVEFFKCQLPGMFNPGSHDTTDFRAQVRRTEGQAYGVVVNSFEELENRYAEEYRKVKGGKLWCIGPLSLSNTENIDKAERGKQPSVDPNQCLKWLDNKDPGSVIYACMGSLRRMSLNQFVELALGLESSGHPFILVIKGGDIAIEKWISNEGFEERVRESGLLIQGWAPQVIILSHSSIGGFLTHCGWNSILEGVCAGVVMITWPMFAEQFLNEKLVVEILRIGVGLGAKGVIYLWEEENEEYKVGRECIRKAIEEVMDGGKEGMERRKRVKDIQEMARKSVESGGSSHHNVTMLIEEIKALSKRE